MAVIGTGTLVLAAGAGFAGRAWWVFAVADNFRVQYLWGLVLGTILLVAAGRRRAAFIATVPLAIHAWLLWPFYVASPAERPASAASPDAVRLRVVTLNVWGRNKQYERVFDFLRQTEADIVVLEEIYPAWVPQMKALEADWPYHTEMYREARYGMAIFSRWPLELGRSEFLRDGVPVITARVRVGETPLAICGVHLSRPLSRIGSLRQAHQLADLPRVLKDKPQKQIVLGDFNSTSWNPRFVDCLTRAELVDTRLGSGVHASWPSVLPAALRIPIDHCLVSKNIRVVRHEIGPPVGSDHLPVIVDLEIK